MAVFFTHVGATRYQANTFVVHHDFTGALLDKLTIGVQIFFGISGFVLLRPILHRQMNGVPTLRGNGYFTRRALRIYPAYWIALLATLYIVRGSLKLHGRVPWLGNFALLQSYSNQARYDHGEFVGMTQAWTLVVEVTFYVALIVYAVALGPATRRFGVRRAHLGGLGVLGVLSTFAIYRVHQPNAPLWLGVLPVNLPFFMVGMALAVFTASAHQSRGEQILTSIGRFPEVCLVSVLVIVLANAQRNTRTALPWLPGLAVDVTIVSLLLVVAVFPPEAPHHVNRALSGRVAVFLGTVSYGIYLWHFAFVQWVADHWFNWTTPFVAGKVAVAALLPTLALAWISHQAIEQPMMAFAKKLTSRSPK